MKAILWDGQKQINGKLVFKENAIHFKMIDFVNTNLNLKFEYNCISYVSFYKIFDLENCGVEIKTKDNTRNVFIVEDSVKLKKSIENKIIGT